MQLNFSCYNVVGNDRQPKWFTHSFLLNQYRSKQQIELGTIDNLNGLLTLIQLDFITILTKVRNDRQPQWFTHIILGIITFGIIPVRNDRQPQWFTHLLYGLLRNQIKNIVRNDRQPKWFTHITNLD